jgi:C-terminal processing protease CtpA/Prc
MVNGVQVGDKLLKVDTLPMRTASRGAIFSEMHGKPGDVRTLLLERNGKPFTVKATVNRY